ncbi:MAG: M23 family metallopeptidase [Ancrocorticia sp.]|uniref:M23 family metallopeptidase n=1 Tax=Ancrocorticia sp. TaxID=2593684 RepID=UPI003F91354B
MKTSIALGMAAVLLTSAAWLWASQPSTESSEISVGAGAAQQPHSGPAPFSPRDAAEDDETHQKDPKVDEPRSTEFSWPSGSEAPVTREFSNPEHRWQPGHRGVDLGMREGQEVLAAGTGTVVYSGRLNDRNVISIEHHNGLRTTYEPVAPSVKKGDSVARGQPIGTLEIGHFEHLSVLHWGAKYPEDRYINPLSLVNWSPIRLWE